MLNILLLLLLLLCLAKHFTQTNRIFTQARACGACDKFCVCTKGSGTFSKKAGKEMKIFPQTGSSEVEKDRRKKNTELQP